MDNGKIVTSAGLASGIDAALHLVSKILGHGRAQQVALDLEYPWDAGIGFVRAALADRLIPDMPPMPDADVRVLETAGDRHRWRSRWEVRGDVTPESVAEFLHGQLRTAAAWSREGDGGDPFHWRFSDGEGRAWGATTRFERSADTVLVTMTLEESDR